MFLQWFKSGGYHVYDMAANAVLKRTGWVSVKWTLLATIT